MFEVTHEDWPTFVLHYFDRVIGIPHSALVHGPLYAIIRGRFPNDSRVAELRI